MKNISKLGDLKMADGKLTETRETESDQVCWTRLLPSIKLPLSIIWTKSYEEGRLPSDSKKMPTSHQSTRKGQKLFQEIIVRKSHPPQAQSRSRSHPTPGIVVYRRGRCDDDKSVLENKSKHNVNKL
ncbi:hypothetical protein LSH36_34g01032 [Paralvinella palmiformis]|uniref:Uncharacterized protein n=1 Tax=Paralvinella palmiformis TaxID=53620 RepID=A0AAD9NE08_9ANNE|nr:hypothetical protein LSH36_34g01032 [Paralvinella palmiformis]